MALKSGNRNVSGNNGNAKAAANENALAKAFRKQQMNTYTSAGRTRLGIAFQ